jgi:hypothetical protein
MAISFPKGAELGDISIGNYFTVYSNYIQTNDASSTIILEVPAANDSAGQITARIYGVSMTFGFAFFVREANVSYDKVTGSALAIYSTGNLYTQNTLGGGSGSTIASDGGSNVRFSVQGVVGYTVDWYITAYVHKSEG